MFGLGKKKRSPIGFERVVKTLANKKNRAPDEVACHQNLFVWLYCLALSQVIAKYLEEIEDLEQRFSLATQTELYDIGIEVGLSQSLCTEH